VYDTSNFDHIEPLFRGAVIVRAVPVAFAAAGPSTS
jgi:hypothetical protein